MVELIAIGVASVVGVGGHFKARDFVKRRLRFTRWVERPGMGLAAGAVTALAAAPAVALLPIVGVGTAIAAGVGVGTGVALGAKDAREGNLNYD